MSPEPLRGVRRRGRGPLQPLLQESPELRIHALARARAARRVAAVVLGIPLAVSLSWSAWALYSLRDFGISTAAPLRVDRAAARLLHPEGSDVTLLVVRESGALPVVALVRADPSGSGSRVLGIPDAPFAKDGSTTTLTVPGSLASGRPAFIKNITALTGLQIAHYVEVDIDVLAQGLGQREQARAPLEQQPDGPPSPGRIEAAVERIAACATTFTRRGSGARAMLMTPSLVRRLRGHVTSDLGSAELSAALRRLGRDATAASLDLAVAPVESVDHRWVISRTATRQLAERMRLGKPFGRVETAVKRITPARTSVTIHNGAGMDGVAAEAARILTREGYRVGPVGNANQFVYDRTLVVYDKNRAAAQAVATALGAGKIVASRGMYSFTTDVLVIVGKDWPDTP